MPAKKVNKEETEEKLTVEQRFAVIEEIIDKMESGEASLEESFALYKEGLGQIKAATESLDTVEKAMQVLNAQGQLEEF